MAQFRACPRTILSRWIPTEISLNCPRRLATFASRHHKLFGQLHYWTRSALQRPNSSRVRTPHQSVERFSELEVRSFHGDPRNLKVTYSQDLFLAEQLLADAHYRLK